MSFALFGLVTGLGLWQLLKGRRFLFTVWAYYLVTLVPVLGIIQVGNQSAADRYTYLPSISVFLLIVFTVASGRSKALRGAVAVASCVIILQAMVLTVQQIGIWKNSKMLWTHEIRFFPDQVSIAHSNLGAVYAEEGRVEEAIRAYEKALAINSREGKPLMG